MSRFSSSEDSQTVTDAEASKATMSPITRFTSFSSAPNLNFDNTEDAKRSRRNSFVHWKDDGPLNTVDIDPSHLSASRDIDSSRYGGEECTKSPAQPLSEVLEEHTRLLNTLESRMQSIEQPRSSEYSERGDGSSERSGLSVKPQWMTWQEYLEPASKATSILEVLVEKPHTNARRRSSVAGPEASARAPHSSETSLKNIERIRIRSLHIINALQQVTEQTFPNSSCFTIHRPFKILLLFKEQIEEYVSDLEYQASQNAFCILGDQCKAVWDGRSEMSQCPNTQDLSERLDDQDTNTIVEEHAIQSPRSEHLNHTDGVCTHEVTEDMLAQREAILHLRALIKFMNEDMSDIFERHRLLRSDKAEMVSFLDIWHLFMAGDLVVTNDETKPMIYRVSILPARQFFPSRRPVKKVKLRSDGSHHQVESIYAEESMSVSTVDVFSYEFDGQTFGPVETRMTIVSFDGLKKITDLPVYPLRFRKDASAFEARMLERGRKYRKLLTVAHWEYNGLSVAEPREQIDSQVIIDIPLAYRKHPETAPKFGLKSWIEDDARIVTEACGVPGCTECFKERFMFDDHRIDRQGTVEFMKMNPSLHRTMNDIEEMTDDLLVLLPSWVYGFVLRSRRWYFLDIDRIHEVQRQSEGFESLILPQGVARLVEGLVQTHGPCEDFENLDSQHQFDLVRGKGKGLIILLHGAPGVGKTSTAECVADYTQRPLFPITCGDIGETAKEVEQNLEQNFTLAHRWGAVLLLDEADVFLQARDKEDMRRNSVVSVFLRVLEYYSGILFLTTNKVGHFDEAFKSRIHVSLYYPPLDEKSTMQVWKMNLRRLAESRQDLEIDHKAIKIHARKHFKDLAESKSTNWNGRQIKNAFQTAIALAEFDARKNGQANPILKKKHFKTVTKASRGFDAYLTRIHGPDADRARREGQRDDDRSQPILFPVDSSSESGSSGDSDIHRKKAKRNRTKAKDKCKTKQKGKIKAKDTEFDESSHSSTSERSEKKRKRTSRKDRSSSVKKRKVGKTDFKSSPKDRDSDDSSSE